MKLVGYAKAAIERGRFLRKRASRTAISRAIGPYVHSVITETEHGYFAVDLFDSEVGGALRNRGAFGADQFEQIRPLLAPDSNVLVVGAHVGTLAIPIARLCADVVAIEANPDTFELLRMNVALNSIDNCELVHIAASDDDTPVRFLLSTDNSGGSKRLPVIRKRTYFYDDPKEVVVNAARLDNVLAPADFDVIVMDIEGSEYFALRGMQRILADARVLIVEFLPHHLRNVAGVSVDEFLVPVADHFSALHVPTTGKIVAREEFGDCLRGMYDSGRGDDGLIFTK